MLSWVNKLENLGFSPSISVRNSYKKEEYFIAQQINIIVRNILCVILCCFLLKVWIFMKDGGLLHWLGSYSCVISNYFKYTGHYKVRYMKFHIVLNLFDKYYHIHGINGLLVSKWWDACQALVEKCWFIISPYHAAP